MLDVEKRKFKRVPFATVVRMMNVHGEWESFLLDISLKGALIKTPPKWFAELGDQHALTVLLDRSSVEIHMQATLAHASDQALGFQCTHIDLESMSHLKRLVELNLGDGTLIERELHALGTVGF